MSVDAQKRRAAERAVEFIESGMKIGLGTGSTARHVVDVIAEKLRAGVLDDVVGVPTSRATEKHATESNVPLGSLDDIERLDLTIDGADEVDPNLDLIKGLGGALLWEKIVASASDRLIIVADDSKRVQRLGERAPVPVEVVPFGWRTHLRALEALGAEPVLRVEADGAPFVTDSGNYIIDARFHTEMPDPGAVQAGLTMRPGVVESGLFLNMATHVVFAGSAGVEVVSR